MLSRGTHVGVSASQVPGIMHVHATGCPPPLGAFAGRPCLCCRLVVYMLCSVGLPLPGRLLLRSMQHYCSKRLKVLSHQMECISRAGVLACTTFPGGPFHNASQSAA
jgi:hypothetical protein